MCWRRAAHGQSLDQDSCSRQIQTLVRVVRMERRGLIRMIPACQAGFVGEVVYLGMQNRERGNVCKTLVCGERPVGRAEVMFQQSTGVSLIPFFFAVARHGPAICTEFCKNVRMRHMPL